MTLTRLFLPFLFLLAAVAVRAQPASQPTSPPIPSAELLKLFQHDLGPRYNASDSDKYLDAHAILEKYFAANTTEERKAIVTALELTGLDANLLGRLARIRANWPALTPDSVYYINERVGPLDVHYFLGVPKNYDRDISWPLVVKLPSADAFVTNPRDADDVQRIYTSWMNDELKAHPDALVIMPLLNLDDLWGPSYVGMNSVMGPILHVGDRANIDPARVYLIGHSMSGHACWNLPLHYPTYFTASNPLAGSAGNDWQRLRVMNLKNLLIVPWADTTDPFVKIDTTRQLVAILRRFKIDVDYIETKGVGHVPTAQITDECYAKVRARTRQLYPEEIALQSNRPETMFNRIDWLQVYQPLSGGEEKKLFFNKRPGYMSLMANTWSAHAAVHDNRIELTTDNVEILRLYLNDQMIDFRRPVQVTVNHRVKFEGEVKMDVGQMLKDQLFLGRGWRYFGGIIDIDMLPPPSTKPTTRHT